MLISNDFSQSLFKILRLFNKRIKMDVINDYYKKYMPSSSVSQITVNDFTSCGSLNSKFSNGTTIVFFYVPQCRFCQEFAPEFSNFADNYSSRLNSRAVAVNMAVGNNNSLVGMSSNFSYSLGVSWPTIIVYYNGNPCSSYTGPRTAKGLSDFISNTTSKKMCDFKLLTCQ